LRHSPVSSRRHPKPGHTCFISGQQYQIDAASKGRSAWTLCSRVDFRKNDQEGIGTSRKNYIRNWFSNMLEFDRPLRHQGIEYRTVENFYQAMKTDEDDLETRRRIAAATPYEAKACLAGVSLCAARSSVNRANLAIKSSREMSRTMPVGRIRSELRLRIAPYARNTLMRTALSASTACSSVLPGGSNG